MSRIEGNVPHVKQEASQGTGASIESTATSYRGTVLPDSQPSQPSARPKSILKASRPVQQTAEDAGLPPADRPVRRRGGLRAESQSLGPVIPEVNEITFGITNIQITERHKKIRQWLAAPDPSLDYHRALEDRHVNAGGWLTQNQCLLEVVIRVLVAPQCQSSESDATGYNFY